MQTAQRVGAATTAREGRHELRRLVGIDPDEFVVGIGQRPGDVARGSLWPRFTEPAPEATVSSTGKVLTVS